MEISEGLLRYSELFHSLRQGALFPLVSFALVRQGEPVSGWARCCGFNLQRSRLYLFPAHGHITLNGSQETGTVSLACPRRAQSLHCTGLLRCLVEEPLAGHLQQKVRPLADQLKVAPSNVFELEVAKVVADRFFWQLPSDE